MKLLCCADPLSSPAALQFLALGSLRLAALGRALLRDPAIIILDEAIASIDPFTEALIQEGLEMIIEYRTAIVIAHRLSTMKHADRIIVMENGRIIETGNHDHLMAQGGHYAELYNTYFRHQSPEYIDEAKWPDALEPKETMAR